MRYGEFTREIERIIRDRANEEQEEKREAQTRAQRIAKAHAEPKSLHPGLVWTARFIVVAVSLEILFLTFQVGVSVGKGTDPIVSVYCKRFAWLGGEECK